MDKDYIYNNSIILIGPVGVGKSIISDALTRKLGCNQISLDDYRKVYYPKYGFDKEKSTQLLKKSPKLWLEYQKPFEIRLVKEVLQNLYEPAVIDFGASQCCYDDAESQTIVAQLLQPFRHIIALEYPSYALKFAETKPLNKDVFLHTDQYDKLAKYKFICDIYNVDNDNLIMQSDTLPSINNMKIMRQTDAIIDRYRMLNHLHDSNERKY